MDTQPSGLAPVSVLVLAAFLFLYGNGSTTLWDRDEPEYAEAGREMAASGDYLVPTLWGKPFLEKPILIYWLIAGADAMFGDSEFAARFFPAVCAVGSTALTVRLGALLFGRRVGLLGAIILATNPQTAAIGKAAVTDSPLLFFILVSLVSFAEIDRGSKSLVWFFGLYGGAAGAALAKGLPGPALIALTIAAFLLWSRDLAVSRRLRIGPGLLLFTGIAGGWFAAANRQSGGELFRVAVLAETFGRAGKPFEGHTGPFFYYPLTILLGFYPWSAFLPQALNAVVLDRRRRFLIAWIAVTLTGFTLARTKLPHYVLPAYPPLALLTAAFLDDALERRRDLVATGWGKVTVALLAGLPILLVPVLSWAAIFAGFDEILPEVYAAGTWLFLVALVATVSLWCRRDRLVIGALAAGSYGLVILIAGLLLPAFERYKISKPMAEAVLARASSPDRIRVFGFREPSLKFYLRGRGSDLESEADLESVPAGLWVVMPCEVWEAMAERGFEAHSPALEKRGFNVSKGRWIRLCAAARAGA